MEIVKEENPLIKVSGARSHSIVEQTFMDGTVKVLTKVLGVIGRVVKIGSGDDLDYCIISDTEPFQPGEFVYDLEKKAILRLPPVPLVEEIPIDSQEFPMYKKVLALPNALLLCPDGDFIVECEHLMEDPDLSKDTTKIVVKLSANNRVLHHKRHEPMIPVSLAQKAFWSGYDTAVNKQDVNVQYLNWFEQNVEPLLQ